MSKQISFEYENKRYELEYTLRTAGQANEDGFILDQLGDKPALMIPKLVYWAFVRHHRGITRKQTEDIYAWIRDKRKCTPRPSMPLSIRMKTHRETRTGL